MQKRSLLRAAAYAAGILLVAWGGLMVFEGSMIFFPMRDPVPIQSSGTVAGSAFSDHVINTEDGLKLHARWFQPPLEPDPGRRSRTVVLFFHGNAGNLSDRTELMVRIAALGVEILIVDYRGYGHSEGKPSEAGLYRDAQATWRFLTLEHGIPSENIVVFGNSLGGSVAIDLATHVEPAGLIVQSSFTSVPDMATRYYPFIPRFVIRTKMDSLSKIPAIVCPKLFIHSTGDEIVPYDMGKALFEAAQGPKTFFEIDGAGHNETLAVGRAAYLESIREFLQGLADRE